MPDAQAQDADAVTRVPLRISAPGDERSDLSVPVRGGVPFPRGDLQSVANVRVLSGNDELPAQVTQLATWPDGSVKWAMVDIVAAPGEHRSLELEYGPGVERADVRDGLEVRERGDDVEVRGPGLAATVSGTTGGLDSLTVGGTRVAGRDALSLVLEALRTRGPDAFPGASRVCLDADATAVRGEVVVDSTEVERRGPIRVRVLVRGHWRMPGWGVGVPDRVKQSDPAEQVPFSIRYTFVREAPVVVIDHQLVFSGEPDRDAITRWGFDLDGQGAGAARLVIEPGVTVDHDGDGGDRTVVEPDDETAQLAMAPLADGFALVREGWETRPVEIGGPKRGDARIDFWPRVAGAWDLRRYAREWAVGESGDRSNQRLMENYAQHAARGIARSHVTVLAFGDVAEDDDRRAEFARALSRRALLVTPPGWIAHTKALGHIAPVGAAEEFTAIDDGIRRYIDYFRFNQALYRWHGKLDHGFWQSRNGQVHRIDRWAKDYGRWGWSLGDGAGRVGHCTLLAFARSGERRFLDVGEAFCRAVYDTSMVHTHRHMENATDSWWHVIGCNHRHNVQPFGCPYIGMRGSNPGGHRILWCLTDDGVIMDGLDIVAAAALDYATGKRPGAFGNSGGSDGMGSGSMALLWKWETTGDEQYRDACRAILDKSQLIPPTGGARLGYGPSFGLFLAAGEYLDLTGDDGFAARFRQLADRALEEEKKGNYLTVLAQAARLTGEAKYRNAVRAELEAVDMDGTLAELPVERWPGHGGWRAPPSRGNTGRDLPYATALFADYDVPGDFPDATPDPLAQRRENLVPEDWHRPAGTPGRRDEPEDAGKLLKLKPSRGNSGSAKAGDSEWMLDEGQLTRIDFRDRTVSRGPVIPWVLVVERDDHGNAIGTWHEADADFDGFTRSGSKLIATGTLGPAEFALQLSDEKVGDHEGMRVQMAVELADRHGEVGGFGIRLPLELGDDPQRVHVAAAGRFRIERWRVDMNDDQIPDWLTSDSRARWPLWRAGTLQLTPGGGYRIGKLSRPGDVAPVWVDQGVGASGWLDVIDRTRTQTSPSVGVTVRLLRGDDDESSVGMPAVTFDHDARELRLALHSPAARPRSGDDGISGAADVIWHDGWRPPLSPPQLSREQFRAMLDDLEWGENIGLLAYRFRLSTTHKVSGDEWKEKLAVLGIEPRDLLVHMQHADALRKHCDRIGVRYDARDVEGTIEKVVAHYNRR